MSSEAKLGHYFDFKGDARRVFEVLQKGGVAICPATIGYGVITSDPRKLETIFLTKQRAATKRHANVGSYATHRELHVMDQRSRDIVDHLVLDLDVPLAVIAPFKEDHPMFKKLDEVTMQAASVNGTIAILVNAGPFQDELTKLSLAANLPILGSSANLTQTGMFQIEIPEDPGLDKNPFGHMKTQAPLDYLQKLIEHAPGKDGNQIAQVEIAAAPGA